MHVDCPYCGKNQPLDDYHDMEDGDFREEECPYCNQAFKFTVNVDIWAESSPLNLSHVETVLEGSELAMKAARELSFADEKGQRNDFQ